MKSGYIATLLLISALLFPALASADDIQVTSENVIFVGDVSEENGKRLVRNLEIYRNTIISLVGLKGKPDDKPLRVYGTKNGKTITQFTGQRGIAGVYTEGLKGPVFVTITKGGFKKDNWATQVALHEYSHHVLRGMSRDNYPRWYSEGFANYLSTFKVEGDIITIGAPNVSHGRALKENRWMSPEVIFGSIHNYPRTNRFDQFYGQSWLYVHYMQNTPELGRKLPVYLDNLEKGQKPIPAFESAYGMTIQDFHKAARDYWGENAFPVMQFKASPSLLNPEITVKVLSDDQALLAYADGQRNFMNKDTAKSLLKKYAKLSEPLQATKEVRLGQGHSAMALDDFDAAEGYVSAALEQSPEDVDVLSLLADVHYHRLAKAAGDDTAKGAIRKFAGEHDPMPVITRFEDVLKIDPNDNTSVTHLVTLYGRSDAPLSETGKKAAEVMAQSYLTPTNVGGHLDLANIYIQSIDSSKACGFYQIARARVSTYNDAKVNDDTARVKAFARAHPQCG
ncbi:hypothetical protein GCM10011309_04680 [Litorimonas cladophorae]|uniref:DUF1570 domain-containing protein n=1 Tax=Litorimonas cladophorae TaxID=1220491 RepID=A0A918KCB6_9PROT|nr:hypothetical protein [Litorimonas cladophorae]GGX58429.1 hypothetical protein GCM10011309_04680 [Litorimonas cladophorae]